MRAFLTGILLSLATLFIAISPTSAQETLIIDGREVTRVIIAPARSPIAKIIKTGLRNDYDAQKFESRKWFDAQKLYYLYGARHFEPLWLTQDKNGNATFSNNAQQILALFKKSYLSGLNPKDYLTDAINIDLIENDAIRLAHVETAFSAAALKYAQDSYGGRINPKKVSSEIDYKPNKINKSDLLLQLAKSENPSQILQQFEPQHREFVALKAALVPFYDGTAEQAVIIPDGKVLRLGDEDERLLLIRQRLEIEFADIKENIYDETLLAAIEKFQTKMGLTSDGIIGPATISAFNGGNAVSKEDIIANMERWKWLPRDLGDFHVFVNIPQYSLSIMKGDNATFTTRVVVGQPKFKTVVFSNKIKHLVVNPYWNIPRSIVRNEIGPAIQASPNYLAAKNMELVAGGKVINASSVDWSTTSLNQFNVRQRPGSGNALGTIKFLFPNKHAIYLHDTPTKSLFSRSRRAFSHGCVRVKNPWDFTKALLQYEPKIKYETLVAQRGKGKGEKWNNVANLIPVHLAYFTLRIDKKGSIRSYSDVYGHNERLKALLSI